MTADIITTDSHFKALLLEQDDDRKVSNELVQLSNDQLGDGDVTVAVKYSTLNYKDGLTVKGLGRLVRNYPHVPGIDYSGVVETSASPDFKPGDEVIVTGWRVGELYWGGFATRARAKSEWLVKKPDGLTLKQSMAIGTAGLTAMLAIMTLEEHGLKPDNDGNVLVTGAAGGVGSIATAVLSNLGYDVTASTGRESTHDYLKNLGAADIIDRNLLLDPPRGPLGSEQWSGCVDNVGGDTLGQVLKSMSYWATVASVGNASGIEFTSNVLPFLLRGVNLCGIDSNTCSIPRRIQAWDRLAAELPLDKLDAMTTTESIARLDELAGQILQGQIQGRTVIDVNS